MKKLETWKFAAVAVSLVLSASGSVAQNALVGPSLMTVSMTQPAEGDPQAKDDLLEGLDKLGANAKERNEVNLDKNMMAIAAGKKGGRYADLAQKMDSISVRNYEYASKGMYQQSDLDALRRRLDSNGWSHLVRNESQGEVNDICVRTDSEGLIRDMVILNSEPKELNIVHLRGHFRMEDVQGAMGSAMGMTQGLGAGAMGMAMGHAASSSHSAPPAPPAPPSDPTLNHR